MNRIVKKYTVITHEPSRKLLRLERALPIDLTDEAYQEEALDILQLTLAFAPDFLLSVHTEDKFPLRPAMQAWSLEHIFTPLFTSTIKKMALVMSPDFITNLSHEQMRQETAAIWPARIFVDETSAREWLLEDRVI